MESTTTAAELLDQLGAMQELGFTVTYLFSVNPHPLQTIELLADVAPDAARP